MQRSTFIARSALISCALKSHLTLKMKKMASRMRFIPQLQRVFGSTSSVNSLECVTFSPLANRCRRQSQPSSKGHNQQQFSSRQFYSGGGRDDDDDRRVKLMDFPQRRYPNIVNSFRNTFFSFLIRNFYDNSFSMEGFLEGALQAATCVSTLISEGNFEDLKGLVEDEAVSEIRRNYGDLLFQQRNWLKIKPSDVYSKFIYQIGMMFDDNTDRRFVEITVVLHGCHHWEKTPKLMEFYEKMEENHHNFYVCNYRFIREYTKGVEDSWIINKLNHFVPYYMEQAD